MIKIDLKMSKKSTMEVKRYAKLMEAGLLNGMKRAMFLAEAESKKSFIENHRGIVHPTKLTARTGNLRRSVQSIVTKKAFLVIGSIGTNVEYGRKHELGTHMMASRPFLYPAIRDNIKKINDIIGKEIERQF